jgi:hypothetical protein
MKKILQASVAVAVVLSMTVPVQANVITFQGGLAPTLAAFQTATGAVSIVGANLPDIGLISDGTLDSEGSYVGPPISFIPPSTQLYSGVAPGGYTDAFGNSFTNWTGLLAGPDLAISASENLLVVNLPIPSYSVGFEFVEPVTNSPGSPGPNVLSGVVDSTFTVTLLAGSTTVHSFTFNATDDTAYFVGAWSDTAFDSIKIVETVGGIDNEYFNRFYAGSTPVPEASSLLLLGMGFLASARRIRRRK